MPTNYPTKRPDLFIEQQERRIELTVLGLVALVVGIGFYYLIVA
jgi:hypothetical protein